MFLPCTRKPLREVGLGQTTVCRIFSSLFDIAWDDRTRVLRRGSQAAIRAAGPQAPIYPASREHGSRSLLPRPFARPAAAAGAYAGGHRSRVTPVPIPNTEVKPATADGTARETVWESRSLPAVISRAEMSSSSRPFVCTGSELLRPERAPAALAERETRGEASGVGTGGDPRAVKRSLPAVNVKPAVREHGGLFLFQPVSGPRRETAFVRASRPQRATAPSRPSEPARYPDLALTTTFFRPTRTSSRCHPSLATPRGE